MAQWPVVSSLRYQLRPNLRSFTEKNTKGHEQKHEYVFADLRERFYTSLSLNYRNTLISFIFVFSGISHSVL